MGRKQMTDDINENTDAMTAYRAGRGEGLKEAREAAFWKGLACGVLASFALFWVIVGILTSLFG